MAENIETINVLKVDGTQAVTTLRELKAEIEKDKDALVALGLVEDQDIKKKAEQDKIIKKLEQDQKLLNQVMAAGKTTTLEAAKAIDENTGSYYELQKALTTLKKEWKSLSAQERDAAEGQEILQKIQTLDIKLKTLDADIGQFQRNVGNYGMTFKQAMDEAQKGAQGLSQGMMALSSIMMLSNNQSESTKKAMAGMQASVMLLSSVKGISGLTEAVQKSTTAQKLMGITEKATTAATKAETTAVAGKTVAMEADTVATEAATVATNKFKYALAATGVGLILIIIGELAAILMTLSEKTDEASEGFRKMADDIDGMTAAMEDNIKMMEARGATQEEIMRREIEDLDTIIDKTNEYFDQLWDDTDVRDVEKRTEAWEDLKNKQEELRKKLLEGKYAVAGFIAAANTKEAQKGMTDLEKTIENVTARAAQLQKINDTLYEKGIIDLETWKAQHKQLQEALAMEINLAEEAAKAAAAARYRAAKENALRILKNAEDAAKSEEQLLTEKYEAELAQLKKFHLDTTALTAKYEADLQALRDKAAEAERKAAEEAEKQRQKEEADRVAAEKKALEESIRNARTAAKDKMAEMDKELAWAKRRNALIEQTDEESAEAEYRLTQEVNQKKLEALKQFYEDALALGDQEGALQYQKQAADLSVEIELEAAEEKKRIYERDKENRIDAAKQSVESISSIFESLADIFEANNKEDEKSVRRAKALRIAAATIDMLQGAVTAYSTAQNLGPPLGPIVGGANAAAVIATGIANIAKIKAQQVSSSATASTGTDVAPYIAQAPSVSPSMNQVRNITGASEEERLNQMAGPQRVYILNSDLEAASRGRRVRVRETTF